ncbi:hybrid sensor histidine kinase/response regulator [Elioraea tepidiphila]|uniref:hybrid sensor histidine kinase/response regulator n=1 Tax=Elioraea tepidiphila TaxID=457934 RepID=UPI0003626D76|nr:hybrid sensor histidine kinase/response regulator [Elioraea tepidiphila]
MALLVRAVRIAIGFAVLLPLIAFGLITKDRWDQATSEAERVIVQETAVAAEHIGRVLETQESILQQIDLVIRGLSWHEIETSPAVQRMLTDFADRRAHVASVWIADEEGRVRAGSAAWPAGTTIADRGYFLAQRPADQGTLVSEPIIGRVSDQRVFTVSRRRTTDNGTFGGLIFVAVAAEYIETFFASLIRTEGVVVLIRPNGDLLARTPPTRAVQRLGPDSQLMQRLAVDRMNRPSGVVSGVYWGRSIIYGGERLYGYQSVEPYGLIASIGTNLDDIYEPWWRDTLRYGLITALLTLLLAAAGLSLLAAARRADAATARALDEAERNAAAQRRIDALERQNAITRVVAGVAHEFNNLLTPILMGAELLRERAAGAEERRTLDSMIGAAERGGRLVADLLSYIQNQFLRIEKVAPLPAIEETIAEFRAGLRDGIALAFEATEPVPDILTDRRQLQLALDHLLDNAQRAMPDGGTITVRLVALPGGMNGGHVLIAVEDTGVGMTPDVLAQAREPFFTTAAYRECPGLGLAMVSGFVGQLGGTLTIDSRPGQGTRVQMRLPIARG